MTTIKTPIEARQLFKNMSDCYADTWLDIGIEMKQGAVIQAMTEDRFIEAIEAYHNQFDCIDKQTAIDFAQHLLKDYSTQEVTDETLNNFLNKK